MTDFVLEDNMAAESWSESRTARVRRGKALQVFWWDIWGPRSPPGIWHW